MIADLLLALGLILSPSSQLRFFDFPVGPGELSLVLWLLLRLFGLIWSGGVPDRQSFNRLLTFWTVFACSLVVGFITGSLIGDAQDMGLVLHDALAYPLLFAVSIINVIHSGAGVRLTRIAWLVALLGGASILLQFLQAWDVLTITNIDPWYYDRFRGWSQNPNQLAFLCCSLVLLSVHLIEKSTGATGRALGIAVTSLAICVGYLTKSDTFRFAVIAGIGVFLLIKLQQWMALRGPRLTIRAALALCVVICSPVLLTLALALLLASGQGGQAILYLAKNGGQEAATEANLRLSLWQQALNRGLDSGLLGLGPGPHLAIPPSILAARRTEVEPEDLDHPKDNGTANFEAHNTYLDLLTQGGGLAVLSFVWLIVTAFRTAGRARAAGLAALIFGLAASATTGNVARNPILWFAITLCLVSPHGQESSIAPFNRARTWRRLTAAGLGDQELEFVKS